MARLILSNSRVPAEMVLGFAGAAASGGSAQSQDGLSIVSIRSLALRNVQLVVGTRSLTVELQASITGDCLDVTRLVAQSSATRLDAHGALTSIAAHKGTFTATAARLNLDELLAVASGFSIPAGPSSAARVDVTIDVSAPEGELGGYRFQKLSSVVHLTPGRMRVAPLRLGMFAGTCDGQLDVSTTGSAPVLSMSGRVQGVDVAAMLREVQESSSMSGRLSGTFSVRTRGASSAAMLSAAHGTGRAVILDGGIPAPGHGCRRSSSLLGSRHPIRGPAADPGSRASTAASHWTIRLCGPRTSRSRPDFDMTGSGLYDCPRARSTCRRTSFFRAS